MTDEAIDPKSKELAMVVAIDAMAKRYSLLPSEVLDRASTFDLVVMDMALTYENYRHDQVNNKNKPTPQLEQQDMISMIERVRNENKNKSQRN